MSDVLVDIEDEPDEGVEYADDGAALVEVGPRRNEQDDTAHFADLSSKFSATELTALGAELCELAERDKQAREKRDKQYEEGIRRTGFGDDAPGGAQFQGASKVVHPLIGEAGIDFQARTIKELMPPDGPAKDKIVGDVTQKKAERAKRKVKWLNWQMTEQMKGFRSDLEQGLGQAWFGGAFYLQGSWSEQLKRPVQRVFFADEVWLPYAASDYLSAERRTFLDPITDLTFRARVRSGMYRDIDNIDANVPEAPPEPTRTEQANDKVEGKEQTGYNEDGMRITYRMEIMRGLENEDEPRPYIVYLDESTKQVLSIYRNWEPDDPTFAEIEHVVEFPFIPWRGANPIGATQLIGGLSGAATGALRALLDSALMQTLPVLLKRKGVGSRGGQSLTLEPQQIQEIEGSMGGDDIRKDLMALPFNPPSPVLLQLLGFLVEAGKGVVRTTLDESGDMNKDVPVGTMLVRQEEGMKVFSAIFGRLHASMARWLRVLHRINKQHLTIEMVMNAVGEPMVMPEDFDSPDDVVPVSDPHIFSEAQRFAQIQSVLQLAQLFPLVYDQREVNIVALEAMRFPDPQRLLARVPTPQRMNAVNENMAVSMGRPLAAFPDQEHLAHLQAHLDYMQSPMFGMSRLFAPNVLPGMLTHIRDHLAMWYVAEVVDIVEEQTGANVKEIMGKDSDSNQRLDILLAIVSSQVLQTAPEVLKRTPPVIERAMALAQELMPQMPQDPAAAKAQADMAETKRKQAADRDKKQIEGAKIEKTAEEKAADRQAKLAAETLKQQSEDARTAAELEVKRVLNAEDNETALTIATMDNLVGNRSEVSTGTGINPGG